MLHQSSLIYCMIYRMPASHHRRIHHKSLNKWRYCYWLFHPSTMWRPFPPWWLCGILFGPLRWFQAELPDCRDSTGGQQWHTCPNHVREGPSFQPTAVTIDEYLNVFHSVSSIVTWSMQKVCNYALYGWLVYIAVRQSVSRQAGVLPLLHD